MGYLTPGKQYGNWDNDNRLENRLIYLNLNSINFFQMVWQIGLRFQFGQFASLLVERGNCSVHTQNDHAAYTKRAQTIHRLNYSRPLFKILNRFYYLAGVVKRK